MAEITVEESGIHWFGEVDMNERTGQPGADYPSNYFDVQIRELDNEVRSMARQIEDGVYTGKDLRKFKERYEQRKSRLEKIISSKPVVDGPLKDKVSKARKELGSLIGDSMFTYSSMNRLTDDPQIEASRMEGACIEIKSPIVAEFVKQRGFRVERGRITRNAAAVVHKVMGKVLGEEILDIEALRGPDRDTRGRKAF